MDVGPDFFDFSASDFLSQEEHRVKSVSEKPRELLLYQVRVKWNRLASPAPRRFLDTGPGVHVPGEQPGPGGGSFWQIAESEELHHMRIKFILSLWGGHGEGEKKKVSKGWKHTTPGGNSLGLQGKVTPGPEGGEGWGRRVWSALGHAYVGWHHTSFHIQALSFLIRLVPLSPKANYFFSGTK